MERWSRRTILAATLLILTTLAAPAARAQSCRGDCGGDGMVTVDELVLAVNIALGLASIGECNAFAGGPMTISDLLQAVSNTISGCSPGRTATPTPTPTPPRRCSDSDGSGTVQISNASPSNGNGAFDITCVTVENAGGTRTELTRVTVAGAVNGQKAELLVYFVTATGAIDTVTYQWVDDPKFPGAFSNLAFCNTPACAGASVDLPARQIILNDVPLGGPFGETATVNGSLTLDEIPTPVPTPTPMVCPGGSIEVTATNVQGTNNSLPFDAVLTSASNFGSATFFSAEYTDCPRMSPGHVLLFNVGDTPVAAGASYQIGLFSSLLNQLQYREDVGFNFREWNANSGTITIDSIDEQGRFHFRVIDAQMRQSTGSTGSFTLNASGVLDPAM
jgi:hypothetical protein